MSDSKTKRRGRRRVTLIEAMLRWRGDEKRYVERHIPDILGAFYREILEFEPVGFVTHTRLWRFMEKYNDEVRCLFAPPFDGMTKPEEYEERRATVERWKKLLVERGNVPRREDDEDGYLRGVITALDVQQAEEAYLDALTYRWILQGSQGEPPKQPELDWSLMTQAELDSIERFNADCDARQEHYERVTGQANPSDEPEQTAPSAEPPSAEPPHADADDDGDVPEVRTKLQAVAWGSPEDVLLPDADRYWWRGKRPFESPREMMKPYLEKIGRLDLLELYSDEIIQYGDLIECRIDGKWR